jgi:hypothetical protein
MDNCCGGTGFSFVISPPHCPSLSRLWCVLIGRCCHWLLTSMDRVSTPPSLVTFAAIAWWLSIWSCLESCQTSVGCGGFGTRTGFEGLPTSFHCEPAAHHGARAHRPTNAAFNTGTSTQSVSPITSTKGSMEISSYLGIHGVSGQRHENITVLHTVFLGVARDHREHGQVPRCKLLGWLRTT